MSARIIDGKAVAKRIREELKERIERLVARHGVRPGLTVILVGDNPASKVYVRGKIAACKEVGIKSEQIDLPADTSQAELLRRIDALNADPGVHGILVQLPLPPHIDIRSVLERIAISKDVDGFHLYNVGGLITGNTIFPPCRPVRGQPQPPHQRLGRALPAGEGRLKRS
jgi:methylenetetrahydrofolate dehydrogenase (NADP+)/methenyltetrahydrofolate cyclohydrolase